MNYTAKELLDELYKVYEMLGRDDPDTYHHLNQFLNSVQEEE
jgi:hypothetical protein